MKAGGREDGDMAGGFRHREQREEEEGWITRYL